MKILSPFALVVASVCFCYLPVRAQVSEQQATPQDRPSPSVPRSAVDLNWTPPALDHLNAEATTRSNFSLDRTSLAFAAGLIPGSESETQQAVAKLDGVSLHLLRFGSTGIADEPAVNDLRLAYHLPGWKHVLSKSTIHPADTATSLAGAKTDLWVLMEGTNVREAVALIESPASLTLVTVAGNISPVDLLHLRGHFGIPRFDARQLDDAHDN